MISNLIIAMAHKCKFCDKEFARENTLAVHMCEPKRRHNQQNETGVRLGFQTYIKFFEMTQGSSKTKTYEDFSNSPYYKAFVKYGWYCVSIRAINIPRFTEWLLKNNKKLDNWTKDSLYGEYLHEYLRVEAVNDALARAIEFSIEWADKNDSPPHDCLRYGNTNALCFAITTGRLSPWVIYNSESGQKFLSELNQEQIAIVWPFIDADYWNRRFKDYLADQLYAKEILEKAGW
jgi:hypothetical protein